MQRGCLQIACRFIDDGSSINKILYTDICGSEHCVVKRRDTLSIHVVRCCLFAVEQVSYCVEITSLRSVINGEF